MHLLLSFVTFCIFLCSSELTVVAQQVAAAAYAPKFTPCPKGTSLLRQTGSLSQSLNAAEAAFVNARRSQVLPSAASSYLRNVEQVASSQGVQLPRYVSDVLSTKNNLPLLAISNSGGGYRSAIFGAGVMTALDGRNTTSVKIGTGGLLQVATYMAGVSGSAWLVGSLAESNFPAFPDLIFGSPPGSGGWLAQLDLIQPSSDPEINLEFVKTLIGEVSGKFLSGFPVTITDIWARTLSRHFVNGTTSDNFFNPNITHGAGQTFSGLGNT